MMKNVLRLVVCVTIVMLGAISAKASVANFPVPLPGPESRNLPVPLPGPESRNLPVPLPGPESRNFPVPLPGPESR